MNPKLVLSTMQRGKTFPSVAVRQMNNRFLSTDVKQQAVSAAESASKTAESAVKNAESAVKNATTSANWNATVHDNWQYLCRRTCQLFRSRNTEGYQR